MMTARMLIALLCTAPSLARAAAPDCPARPLAGDWPSEHAAAVPLSLRCVRLGGFLGHHVDASNASLLACLASPIPKAVEARAAGREPPPETRRLATDSDLYKWLEGACYAVAYEPSRGDIRAAVDKYVDLIARLQEPDGYVGTRLSPAAPFDEKARHDLYVAGHLIEAAVAHRQATGDRTLLDAAARFADFYLRAFRDRHPYFRLIGQEHPEIELALVRLGRATGEQRFIDFAGELTRRAELAPQLKDVRAGAGRRHAVRLCYQLTGAAELFLQTGSDEFRQYLPSLWDEIVSTRMYVTGGIGYNEVVPERPYDLPQTLESNPHRDIAETCASVSLMMLSWRLHGMSGDSRPYDVIETILYNHCLGALSPDHTGNFYYNPLRRVGDLKGRTDHGGNPVRRTMLPQIHSTTCCLPNAWRFFAQLPEYVFTAAPDRLRVNLYTDAVARHRIGDVDWTIEVKTAYPHDGRVEITLRPARPASLTLSLRIPGWCGGASVSVNGGEEMAAAPGRYHDITREWKSGDRIVLHVAMSPVAVFSPPQVQANLGQVAFRRGPLVYCLEQQDAAGLDLQRAVMALDRASPSSAVRAVRDDVLGFFVLRGRAGERTAPPTRPEGAGDRAAVTDLREVTLIPFYDRANRAEDTRWLTWIPFE